MGSKRYPMAFKDAVMKSLMVCAAIRMFAHSHQRSFIVLKSMMMVILYLMAPAPKRPLYTDQSQREPLAAELIYAGAYYGIDPFRLSVWGFHESSFRDGVVSKSDLQEYGVFQVHGVAKFMCKQELKRHHYTTLDTRRGQILCGAYLMRHDIEKCGSVNAGLGKYASGRCGYAQRLVNERLEKADCLRRMFANDSAQTVDIRPWEENR